MISYRFQYVDMIAAITYLVCFVDKNRIWSQNNPSPLPCRFPENRRLVRLLPVHPSLEIDHVGIKRTTRPSLTERASHC